MKNDVNTRETLETQTASAMASNTAWEDSKSSSEFKGDDFWLVDYESCDSVPKSFLKGLYFMNGTASLEAKETEFTSPATGIHKYYMNYAVWSREQKTQ